MAEPNETSTAAHSQKRHSTGLRILLWILGIVVGLAVILFVASFFIDEPVRRVMEKRLNSHMKGYTVRIPKLHIQLIGFSITFRDLTIFQQAHPSPPIIQFPYLKASVHWREIFSGKLVGELKLVRPHVHLNLEQLKTEVKGPVPVKQRGWQQAVEDIYPLKINHVIIDDGDIAYFDPASKLPLKLTRVNFDADNIRNIHLPDKVYPSSFHLDTHIFGSGRGKVDGKANFLAEPVPGIKARFSLEKVPIDALEPVIARANLAIKGGQLKTSGDVEYAPKIKEARIRDLLIHGMEVTYLHTAETAAAEKRRAATAKKAAKKVSNEPGLLLRIDQLNLTGCNFGMINKDPQHSYHLFLSDSDLHLTNLSNQFSEGTSRAHLTGKFMGTGATTATALFRPKKKSADFDLYLRIDNTQLTGLNQLLHSYANFTVNGGTFSLITELHVKNNYVTGYIKPFFKQMRVKKEKKGILHRVYEVLIQGLSKLLENRPHKDVATRADISGPLQSPDTSTWQVVTELIRNAFFQAILPTFDREAQSAAKR